MKRILIEIGHPAHVHQFKNMYWELTKKGWQGLFVTKDKECAIDLLKAYDLPHVILGKTRKGIGAKILSLPFFAYKMLRVAASFKPDIFVSRVSPLSGWSSSLMRKPHITFTDTENVRMMDFISEPFADVVLTSPAYLRDHGKKQIRYPGYHELAYLHPNRFKPNPAVLGTMGITQEEHYAIVRFVSWSAHHDVGQKGMSLDNKMKLVSALSKNLKVFITSEAELPSELRKYQIRIRPDEMHNALAFADIFIGEGATMAEESAVLGTPAIYINSITGGVIQDLESYGLLFRYSNSLQDQEMAFKKAVEFSENPNIKSYFTEKRDIMLKERIDVTGFMCWFVDGYPESKKSMLDNRFSFDMFYK